MRQGRFARMFTVALGTMAVLLTMGGPVGAAAPTESTHWSRGSQGSAVATVRVESGRAAAALAAAQPRSVERAKLPNLKVPTGAPKTMATRPSTAKSAPTPNIVIPDLVVPTQFDGLGQEESGDYYPADPWVAVNSSYVVQAVNVAIRVSNRSGAEILTVPLWAMFAVPLGQLPADARVIWDAAHGRWVAEVLSFKDDFSFSLNYQILAVSDGSDPTAGWTVYQFAYTNLLPDYPSIASSGDKIVIADNLFDNFGSFLGAHIATVTWSSLLAGGAMSRIQCLAAGLAHPRAAQVLSAGNDVHLISELIADGRQIYYRITGSGDCSGQYLDATNVSNDIGFSAFTVPPDPRQNGPDTIANAVDERPTDAIWMAGKLWYVSTFPVTYDGGSTYNDAVVLWGLNTPPSGAPTFNDVQVISPADGVDAYMGGIGMSRNGILFVVYSQSSATEYVSLYANRVAGGSLGTPQLLDTSDASTSQERWGDYAGVAADPVGYGSVWASHMLVDGDGDWRTTVARLLVDSEAPTNPGVATASALVSTVLTSNPAYRIAWAASTDTSSGSVIYLVEESVDAGAYGSPTWLTATSLVRPLPLGHTYRFRVTAFDPLGNNSGTVSGALLHPLLYQSPTSKSGTWHTSSSSSFSGGSTWYATANGASATFKSTGVRSLGFVTTRALSRGSFRVYIDGVLKKTISAYGSTAYRRIMYQFTWATPGTHSIKIVVRGTAGHPRVDVDAFLVLKNT